MLLLCKRRVKTDRVTINWVLSVRIGLWGLVEMLNTVRAACVGLALMLLPTDSLALTSTYIDGVGGVWGSVTPNNGTVRHSLGGSRIAWGLSKTGKKSAYRFDKIVNAGPHDLDQTFDIGRFTHSNRPIYGAVLTGASLAVTITGRLVDGLLSQDFSLTTVFDVIHDETKNYQKNCPYGDKPPCGDLITFMTNTAKSESIEFNGITYLFEVTGFLGGLLGGNSMFSDENRRNSAILQGKMTAIYPPSPVPLPAALPLFAVAIGAAGLASRRKRAKV
jgi:hypothetical protein